MAQEHLAVANACMLRRVTSREAWSRSTTVYSTSKPITTEATMMLVEEGMPFSNSMGLAPD